MVPPTTRLGTTTSPPIPTKSELRWPVARLPSMPNSSTDRRANRHGDVSRTIYRVSLSTSSRPTARFRSFVCKPVHHRVHSTSPLLSSVLGAIRLCPPDHVDDEIAEFTQRDYDPYRSSHHPQHGVRQRHGKETGVRLFAVAR